MSFLLVDNAHVESIQQATHETKDLLDTIADKSGTERAQTLRSLANHYRTAIDKGQTKVI